MSNKQNTPINRNQLINDFLEKNGWKNSLRQSITGDASFRRYERVIQEDSERHIRMAILMDAPPEHESIGQFIKIDRFLRDNGLSAPDILASDLSNGLALLEDLKVDSFSLVLSGASLFNSDYLVEQRLYRVAVDVITKMQTLSVPDDLPHYNDDTLLKEAILFPEWYLPYKGIIVDSAKKKSYAKIWYEIFKELEYKNTCFVHRDFHADNLIWLPEREDVKRVGILDFQDALHGCPAYDMVSLLEDARRDVSSATVLAMIDYYLTSNPHIDPEKFRQSYAILGAQRNIKIIGIFARLAIRDKKHKYLSFIPRVWRHLEHNLHHPVLHDLKKWLDNTIYDRSEDPRKHKLAHTINMVHIPNKNN